MLMSTSDGSTSRVGLCELSAAVPAALGAALVCPAKRQEEKSQDTRME